MITPNSILISGATGYLGRNLVRTFLREGFTVFALVRENSDRTILDEYTSQVVWIEIGPTFPVEAIRNAAPRIIVHCATNYGRGGESPAEIRACNVDFAVNLLDAAIESEGGTFVNIDTSLPAEVSTYAQSKAEFREVLQTRSGIQRVNLVLEHFYGPFDSDAKFVTRLIRAAASNSQKIPKKIPLTRGEQRRDFVYIDDVVDAVLLVIRKLGILSSEWSTFQIGSGNAISIRSLAEKVEVVVASRSGLFDFGAVPYRDNEVMLSEADISHIVSLGWSPKVDLENGLRRVHELEGATFVSKGRSL